MRKALFLLLAVVSLASLVACNDYETYGDKKEKERKAIREFLADSSFVVISESQFHQQGDVTDVAKRQFVYMDNSGVYMQIVHQGCGKPLQDGENSDLLVRFVEVGLIDSTAIYNDVNPPPRSAPAAAGTSTTATPRPCHRDSSSPCPT